MVSILLYILLGIVVGIISGVIGIGGGILLVPAFVLLFGLSQHEAQGTTLALLIPPIGILAAWSYYKAGNINIPIACFVAIGFLVGGLFGGMFANILPEFWLKKIFGIALLLISLKTLLFS